MGQNEGGSLVRLRGPRESRKGFHTQDSPILATADSSAHKLLVDLKTKTKVGDQTYVSAKKLSRIRGTVKLEKDAAPQ